MTRPGPFEQIFNLTVGGEATARPKPGEPIDKALQRIKVRLAKYAADGRHFRAKIHGDVIRVQRTCEGHNTKIGDWLMMRAGDRLLLKTCPTPADIKKARGSCDYMQSRWWRKFGHLPFADRQIARMEAPPGCWAIISEQRGRLVVECWADVDGGRIDATLGDAAPLRTLWAGEWPKSDDLPGKAVDRLFPSSASRIHGPAEVMMNQAATRPTPPRLSYSVAEASHVTGIGRTTLYKLMGDGSLSSVKIGNRRLIPASALQAILQAA